MQVTVESVQNTEKSVRQTRKKLREKTYNQLFIYYCNESNNKQVKKTSAHIQNWHVYVYCK
jgi:hypothetical protein